jgi:5-formyltetrahydrofolate cyclo-ligase
LNQPSKAQLRTTLLAKRRALVLKERVAAATIITESFVHSPFFSEQNIACYLAVNNEVDCSPLIQEIWRAKKTCYLPVITSDQCLEFARYEPDDELRLNQYQILEPQNMHKISLIDLKVIVMPLIGFDLQGNRIGMGAGYYDRTFSVLTPKPALIGFAYECQCVEAIPSDPWDVKLSGVITEKKLYSF